MTLETVVQAILEQGKAEADLVLEGGRLERDRMLEEVRTEGRRLRSEAEARARQTADRRRVQELARAELEARKIVLAAQKEALDDVYRRTLGELGRLPDNEGLVRAILRSNEAEWKAGRVYANARDEPLVRRLVGDRFAGTIDSVGGLVIEASDGTRRIDLRYESILRDVWEDSVKEVAEILWPSAPSKS
jgi:V/A-type H+-transporting ATPase subunit E